MHLINSNLIEKLLVSDKKIVENYKWSDHDHGFLCSDRHGVDMARVKSISMVNSSSKYCYEVKTLFTKPCLTLVYMGSGYNEFYFKTKSQAKKAAKVIARIDKFFNIKMIKRLGGKQQKERR